jgi:hypothetical protein
VLREDADGEPDVLVLTTLAAPRPGSRLGRRRARDVEDDAEAPALPLTRATVVRPRPLADERAARDWLDRVSGDRETAAALAREAALRLNLAIHAHRTATGDPHLADVDPARAVALRFGYGTGDEVADGRWQAARELPEGERRRLLRRDYEALRPQERVAAVLGGRERVGPHEELILRARGDLDAGRLATCALGLHAGLEALLALAPLEGELAERLSDAVATAAEARRQILAGVFDAALDRDALERAVRSAEAALRQRARE